MRTTVLFVTGLLFAGASLAIADPEKPNLSGTWKLEPAGDSRGDINKDLVLVIDEKGQSIHITETRGPNAKADVSSLTCDTNGAECAMLDGGSKATAFVYYNGPALVVLKSHGRRGDAVEKRRLLLSPAGNSLVMEITHLEPAGKDERLVLSKAR